jgi:hypothetical protein
MRVQTTTILPDATVSDLDAARSIQKDLGALDVEDLRAQLWLVNQELSRRTFYRVHDRAVNLANGDYMPTRAWYLWRRNSIEAELRRRR